MSNAARILNEIVVEVVTLPEGVPLDECYHPDAGFVACPDGIEVGQSYKNGAFGPAPPPPPPTKPDLVAYAAWARWAKETGGLTYQGHKIATDETSQSKIGNAALGATVVGSAFMTKWKVIDGTFFDLDQAGMLTMATAVLNFVNACYESEATVSSAIAAGSITTTAQIDAAFAD